MRTLFLLLALSLAACQPAGEPAAPDAAKPEPQATSETPALAEPSDRIVTTKRLAGEYRIAGVDGQGIDLPYGITASISADRILVSSDCVRMAWSYRFAGDALVTGRVPVESCARGLTAEEQAIMDAFDAATAVAINESNGYEFTGGGHSVTLFTQ